MNVLVLCSCKSVTSNLYFMLPKIKKTSHILNYQPRLILHTFVNENSTTLCFGHSFPNVQRGKYCTFTPNCSEFRLIRDLHVHFVDFFA